MSHAFSVSGECAGWCMVEEGVGGEGGLTDCATGATILACCGKQSKVIASKIPA